MAVTLCGTKSLSSFNIISLPITSVVPNCFFAASSESTTEEASFKHVCRFPLTNGKENTSKKVESTSKRSWSFTSVPVFIFSFPLATLTKYFISGIFCVNLGPCKKPVLGSLRPLPPLLVDSHSMTEFFVAVSQISFSRACPAILLCCPWCHQCMY